jgi:hypothetical protein
MVIDIHGSSHDPKGKYTQQPPKSHGSPVSLDDDPPTEIDAHGTKFWRNEGYLLDRDGGPAEERADGSTFWYRNGELHREGGPAIECWSEDSAFIDPDEDVYRIDDQGVKHRGGFIKEWYLHGKLHNPYGPAIECASSTEYYIDDKPHREDGPAIERADGTKEWWIDGVRMPDPAER